MTSEVLSPNGKHGSITAPSFLPRMPENIWLCKDPVSLHLQIHIFKVKCCIKYMGDNAVTINYGNTSLKELQLNKSMVEQASVKNKKNRDRTTSHLLWCRQQQLWQDLERTSRTKGMILGVKVKGTVRIRSTFRLQTLEGEEVRVCLVIPPKNLFLTSGVEHFVLPWPGSSAVNPLEREHQMTNTPGSCWVFICHICLSDKAFPAGREGHLTGLPWMWPTGT